MKRDDALSRICAQVLPAKRLGCDALELTRRSRQGLDQLTLGGDKATRLTHPGRQEGAGVLPQYAAGGFDLCKSLRGRCAGPLSALRRPIPFGYLLLAEGRLERRSADRSVGRT